MSLSRHNSATRRRQSMNTAYGDIEDAQLYEVNTTSSQDLGYYRRSEEDSEDLEVTPMIKMDTDSRNPQRDGLVVPNTACYKQIYITVNTIGAILVVLVGVWIFKYLGGIGFSKSNITFNFHPLFMVIGFIILFSNGMLIYRTLRGEPKPKLKLFHAILNGSCMGISLLGSLSVVYFHADAGIPHFYSLHSWLGILTWTMFISLYAVGFFTFLWPGGSYNMRSMIMPYHRFAGVATFVLASATCLTGLNEKAIFALGKTYADLPAAGVIVNVIALVLVAYASLIVYLVTKPEYKRIPLPEEQNTAPKPQYQEVPASAAP